MKTRDILKSGSVSELESELAIKRDDLRQFRFAIAQSKIKNVKSGRASRRAIARILTRIGQIKKT